MTLKEMVRHNSKGIFTVNQLSYTFRSNARRSGKRSGFPITSLFKPSRFAKTRYTYTVTRTSACCRHKYI